MDKKVRSNKSFLLFNEENLNLRGNTKVLFIFPCVGILSVFAIVCTVLIILRQLKDVPCNQSVFKVVVFTLVPKLCVRVQKCRGMCRLTPHLGCQMSMVPDIVL